MTQHNQNHIDWNHYISHKVSFSCKDFMENILVSFGVKLPVVIDHYGSEKMKIDYVFFQNEY